MNWRGHPDFAFPNLSEKQVDNLSTAVACVCAVRGGMARGQFMRLIAATLQQVMLKDAPLNCHVSLAEVFGEMLLAEMHEPTLPGLLEP